MLQNDVTSMLVGLLHPTSVSKEREPLAIRYTPPIRVVSLAELIEVTRSKHGGDCNVLLLTSISLPTGASLYNQSVTVNRTCLLALPAGLLLPHGISPPTEIRNW